MFQPSDKIIVQGGDSVSRCEGRMNTIAEPEPFGNSDGPEYENGLAFVRMGNRCGYIDEEGREVYFWDDVE